MLAWRAVEGSENAHDTSAVRELFDRLLSSTQEVLDIDDKEELQRIILLVGTAAIGFGIAGEVLSEVLGMNGTAVDDFPMWLTERMS